MNFVEDLLGGGQQQQGYQDFVNRYQQGSPAEGYSDQEVMDRYQQVSQNVPSTTYVQAAEEAFTRMSPQEREQFGSYLQHQAQQNGVNVPGLNESGPSDRFQNPNYLAQVTGQIHQQQPGLLGQILSGVTGGGAGGGMLGSMLGGNSAGSGAGGSLFSNPMAKAALAGIAAMAAKRIMGGQGR